MDRELTILLPNDVPLELILVKPGRFIMGSKEDYVDELKEGKDIIHITQSFYIGKYPVTQAQWKAVAGSNPSWFLGLQRPVENVSWDEIVIGNQNYFGEPSFLARLNGLLAETRPNLAVIFDFRLPLEIQWEYAAKGGADFGMETLKGKNANELYPAYSGSDRLETCGWLIGKSEDETKPVGLKQANELGLFDMSGNVGEWCDNSHFQPWQNEIVIYDTERLHGGGLVATRGGGHHWSSEEDCRSTNRNFAQSKHKFDKLGFRLVLFPVRAQVYMSKRSRLWRTLERPKIKA